MTHLFVDVPGLRPVGGLYIDRGADVVHHLHGTGRRSATFPPADRADCAQRAAVRHVGRLHDQLGVQFCRRHVFPVHSKCDGRLQFPDFRCGHGFTSRLPLLLPARNAQTGRQTSFRHRRMTRHLIFFT